MTGDIEYAGVGYVAKAWTHLIDPGCVFTR